MVKVGHISVPLQKVERIGDSDIQVLDFLFDMNIPDLATKLQEQADNDAGGVMVVGAVEIPLVAIVFFKPPEALSQREGQNYLVFAAEDMDRLTNYFVSWAHANIKPELDPILSLVCHILRVKCTGPHQTKFIPETI